MCVSHARSKHFELWWCVSPLGIFERTHCCSRCQCPTSCRQAFCGRSCKLKTRRFLWVVQRRVDWCQSIPWPSWGWLRGPDDGGCLDVWIVGKLITPVHMALYHPEDSHFHRIPCRQYITRHIYKYIYIYTSRRFVRSVCWFCVRSLRVHSTRLLFYTHGTDIQGMFVFVVLSWEGWFLLSVRTPDLWAIFVL